jgi:hypothetical protein
MSTWVVAAISSLSGIAGVATGSVLQARLAQAQELRRQLYEPAADLSARLRGAATSVDYLIRPLVKETKIAAGPDAYRNAKHLIDEADARRAGTEFAFPPDSGVYEAATAAVGALRAAFEAATQAEEPTDADPEQLKKRRDAYETAIGGFNEIARAQMRRLGRLRA